MNSKSFKKTLACAYSIFLISGMMSISTGQLLPYIRDAKLLDYAFCGIIVSLHSIGNLFSSFMAGVMPGLIGRKKSMLLFNACIAVSYILILWGSSKYIIALAFLLTGIARGASSNYLNTEVNNVLPGNAAALSVLHASYAVGALLFPVVLMLLVSRNPDRWFTACVFMLIMGIISLLLYYLMPAGELTSDKKKTAVNYAFLKDKMFYCVLFGLFFYLCFEQGVIGWLVTYLKDVGYLQDPLASLTTTIQWTMILIGRLIVAYISTKIDKRKLLVVMGTGTIIFFVFLLFAKTTVPIIIAIAGFGLSMAGIYPTITSFGGDLMKKYPMCWSFILTGAGLGSVLMPTVIGFVADAYGIYMGMCTIIAVVIIEMVLILLLIKNSKSVSAGSKPEITGSNK